MTLESKKRERERQSNKDSRGGKKEKKYSIEKKNPCGEREKQVVYEYKM